METKVIKRTVLFVVLASLAIVVCVQGGTVTSPPIQGFTTADSSKDIVLSTASSTYSADFSSYANYSVDLHSVAGYYAASGGAGWADIQHEDSAGLWSSSAYTMLGRGASGNTAWVAYKFVLDTGYVTASGGTISAHMDFTGSPGTQGNNMWIGASESLTIGGSLFSFTNPLSDQVTMLNLFGDNGYNYYHGTANVAIPDGVSEFYVLLADAGNTGYMAYTSLDVNAVLVPEPATLLLLSLGGLFLRRSKK